MANTSQARDGRMSLSWILGTGESVSSGTLKVGDIVYVTAKASTSSVFGDTPINKPFIAFKSLTLASGDTCVKYPAYFLGQATGKSLNASKNTTDVTMDYDETSNSVTDGVVTKSGSISGMNIVETLAKDSGVNMLKTRFDSITEVTSDDTIIYKAAETTEKDIIMIVWNGRNAKTGDILDIEIVPVLFTSMGKSGEYNSSQGLDFDFTTLSSDEDGREGGTLQIPFVDGILPGSARPVIA